MSDSIVQLEAFLLAESVRVIDVVETAFLLVLLVLAICRLPAYWRGNVSIIDRVRPWWPYGAALLRGWQRALAVGVGAFAFGVAAAVCGILNASYGSNAVERLIGVLAIVMVTLVLLMLVVMLFNRPKFMVPPRFRDQRGALSEWFGPRRRR